MAANPHCKCLDRLAAIHGTKVPMKPLAIITIGNNGVAATPTLTCTDQCLTTFICPHLAKEGQNEGDHHGHINPAVSGSLTLSAGKSEVATSTLPS